MKPIFFLLTILIVPTLTAQYQEKIYKFDFSKIDSVSLVEYTAIIRYNREPKLKSYQPDMDSLERQEIDLENEKIKKEHEELMNHWFPNRVEGRDMSIPPETVTIINKKGEFYPNTKWETYETFPKDSVIRLLKILNCAREIPQYILVQDTIYPVDSTEMPMIVQRYVKPTLKTATSGPHLNLGIILWHKGEVLQIISTGYYGTSVVVGYLENGQLHNQNCVVITELRKELRRLGYFRDY